MLGMGGNTVKIIIEAKDRASAVITKVNTQMKTMGGATGKLKSSMGGLGSKMSALVTSMNPVAIAAGAAAIALATMGGAAIKASLEFEKAFATIRVGTGATGEALEGLNDDFRTVFGTIPSTAGAISGALAAMNTTTGASGTVLQDLTKNIMDVSRMLGEDGTGNAQAFGEAMKQWQIPAASGVGLMEQFFQITQTTGLGFGTLTGAMNAYGPVLQNAGFAAAESAELFGRLEGSGIAVSRVMPGLNAAFRKWAEEGINGKDALEETINAILNAETSMEALTIATDVFGAEGAQRMTTAVRNGTFELASLGEMLEGTEGIIMKTSEATLQFGDKWTIFKNKVTAALVPAGDVITGVLGNAIEGLSGTFDKLQNIAGPTFDLITIKFQVLKAFLEGFLGPIITALAPLKETFDAFQQKLMESTTKLSILTDIFTIITGTAKWLGNAIGTLVAMGLTPLVAKLKEGIDTLANFYDKLGPIKGALEWVGEGVHNVAESFRDTKPPIEEVEQALEKLAEAAPKAPKAVADAWALAIKSFQEGTGSYKEAIGGIEERITKLTEEWMTATDKRKAAIEKEVDLLKSEKDTLEELKQTAEDALSSTAKETEEATQKMEEFKVTIGDTTIEFKGAAAEVVKNADAYEKLQKSAKTLIDLDWSTFTEFEAALPNIEAGIDDMASSFTGFRDILSSNIERLDSVKESVMDISEIAAPFLEAGFLDSVTAIGDFAGALSNAGSAINAFGDLTEVNVEGCINFSTSVYSMVSALGVLETQMHDMKPAFADMEAGMKATLEAFVYPGGGTADIEARITDPIKIYKGILDKYGLTGNWAADAMEEEYGTNWARAFGSTPNFNLEEFALEALGVPGGDLSIFKKARDNYNNAMLDIQGSKRPSGFAFYRREYDISAVLKESGDNINKYAQNVVHSSSAIEIAVNKQVQSLDYWSDQLTKITDALKPYLDFMRTLNELTALSALSIDDINAGFSAITGTLVNLSSALEKVDFAPVMESLFGESLGDFKFAGGAATNFVDLMQTYSPKLNELTTYTDNLSGAISNLVIAFDALSDMEDSVLMDTDALANVFENIEDIMNNLSNALSAKGGNFAAILTTSFTDLLATADPFIVWFRKNSVQVTEFNSALSSFMITIKHVVDAMDMLKRMSETILPTVTELEAGFGKTGEAISRFTEAVSTSFTDVKTEMVELDKEWAKHKEGMDTLLESLGAATNTITTVSSEIVTLSASLKELKDMSVLSMRDIDEALKAIPVFLDRFVDALRLNMYDIKESLKDLDVEWQKHAEEMKDTMPSYEASTEAIGKLVGSFLSLHSALKSLSEMGTISSTTFDKGFSSLIDSISNFAVSLANNVDALIYSLQKLRVVWVENEAVLFPLIMDFAIISDNLYGVAHNANRMAKEFGELNKNAGTLEEGFESLMVFINQVVKSTKEFYTTEAAAELATYIEDVGKVITSFGNLERELKGAMNKIQNAIGSAVANIEGKLSSLSNLVRSGYDSGANFLGAFIVGIYSMFGPLELALMRAAALVKAYLGVSSNTQMGPLARLTDWGPNIIRTISEGIENGMPTLNATFGSIAPSIGAGVGGSRTSNVNLYVTQNISDVATADYANQGLARVLSRHEIM